MILGMIAGRLWWLLRWLGHQRVALLDGGWRAWQQAGGATTPECPVRTPTRFEVSLGPAMMVEVDEVLDKLHHPNHVLLDARGPDRFRGENETIDPVGGHIPGARNRFFRENLTPDGLFKPVAELRSDTARCSARCRRTG